MTGALPDAYSYTLKVTGWVNVLAGIETVAPPLVSTEAGNAGLTTWLAVSSGVPAGIGVKVRVIVGVIESVDVGVIVSVGGKVGVCVDV